MTGKNSSGVVIRAAAALSCSAGLLLLAACAPEPIKDSGADQARDQLAALRSDPNLGSRAPLQMKEAQDAVDAAEAVQTDPAYAKHLSSIANDKIATAKAAAQTQYQQDQMKVLADQRDQMRLKSRDVESEQLRQRIADLQESLHAKQTDRGLVFTLGDVLFETGKADLKPGAEKNLSRLAEFLKQYPDRSVTIEGHTDSTGTAAHNRTLSQARADSVRGFLARDVAPSRISAVGQGQDFPVASNGNAAGRQQNRRVEVIVSNPPAIAAAASGSDSIK